MPRIIFKCPYLKGGSATAKLHIGNLVQYIATRDGVEFVTDANRSLPTTSSQQELIAKILTDIPDAKTLFEYEDYVRQPTVENASEFITQALDYALHENGNRDYYVKYIAERPRVEKLGTHGLFTDAGTNVVLSQVCDEVAAHTGNIWTPIISLRREDAVRLSYDSARQWQALLRSHAADIAASMKINPDNFKWFASFHNEAHHPHVHMVCYSTDPFEGYLTKGGIREIKSALARDIFRQDLTHIYEQQTDHRNRLNTESLETMRKLCTQIKTGTYDNPALEQLLLQLSESLSKTSGKKVYAFLKPEQKVMVDQIVDELAKDTRVSACYDAWYDMREEVLRTYNDTLPPRIPLSEQKEFKPIKNMVITEAMQLTGLFINSGDDVAFIPDEAPPLLPEPLEEPQYDSSPLDFLPDDDEDMDYSVDWNDTYKQAREFLFGSDDAEPDFTAARDLFLMEAQEGNALAMHDLGRMYADGLGVDADADASQRWYNEALTAFLSVESERPKPYTQYRIGKMYAAGLGTDQNYEQAAAWFENAIRQNHKYAQYSLAGLYYHGHGVAQDSEKAFTLYEKSAAQGNAYASYEIAKMLRDGIGVEQSAADADRHFQTAFHAFIGMESGGKDDRLQYRIGQMLRDGVGTDADITKATGYFERSAKLGNPHAQYALAKIYLADENDSEKISQAVEWLHKSADSGNPFAQYALGKLYRDGTHVEKDISKAVDLLTKAAVQDNEYAAYALGKLYLSGEDVQKDVAAAIDWLTKSAEQNNQFAQYALGKLYLSGEDVKKDVPAAVNWLIKSAEQNNQFAQYALGKLYLSGEDVQKDVTAAVDWLIKSAEQNNQFAQYALGKLYLSGKDVQKNVPAAVDWLIKSAEQNNQFAQYALGKLYLSGEDVQKDVAAAIDWLLKSAEQENQFAQYQLGKLYLMGKDVARDREQALHWLTLSAEQGNKYAQFFLDNFDKFQDPSMFMAATRLLQELGKIFEEQHRQLGDKAMQIDRKRMRVLREKKMAQGHARDDHEQKQAGGA